MEGWSLRNAQVSWPWNIYRQDSGLPYGHVGHWVSLSLLGLLLTESFNSWLEWRYSRCWLRAISLFRSLMRKRLVGKRNSWKGVGAGFLISGVHSKTNSNKSLIENYRETALRMTREHYSRILWPTNTNPWAGTHKTGRQQLPLKFRLCSYANLDVSVRVHSKVTYGGSFKETNLQECLVGSCMRIFSSSFTPLH